MYFMHMCFLSACVRVWYCKARRWRWFPWYLKTQVLLESRWEILKLRDSFFFFFKRSVFKPGVMVNSFYPSTCRQGQVSLWIWSQPGLQSSRIARAPQRNPAFKKNVSTVVVLTTLYCKYLWNCVVKDYTVVSGSKTWLCHFLVVWPWGNSRRNFVFISLSEKTSRVTVCTSVLAALNEIAHISIGECLINRNPSRAITIVTIVMGLFVSCIRLGTLSPSAWYN